MVASSAEISSEIHYREIHYREIHYREIHYARSFQADLLGHAKRKRRDLTEFFVRIEHCRWE